MGERVFVDETKRSGFVLALVAVADPEKVRKMLRGLVLPGQRRIHMKQEQPPRRRAIVSAIVAVGGIELTIYDAGRRHPTERDARSACLTRLVEDLAITGSHAELLIEADESLLRFDNQRLVEAVRSVDARGRIRYVHSRAQSEPLLALPDVAAWCWAHPGDWRRRVSPILKGVRTV